MKEVYIRSIDAKGNDLWSHAGTFETWRETHAVRTLTKTSRKNPNGMGTRVSMVYDSVTGKLLRTP